MYAQHYQEHVITWRKNITYPGVKPGVYSITSEGDVINNNTEKLLSQASSHAAGGYRSVGLQMEDGSRKTHPVHRLVAHEYVPKTEEDIEFGRNTVDHKNMITDDNHKDNLRWTTNAENFENARTMYNNGTAPYYQLGQKDIAVTKDKSNWGRRDTRGSKNGMAEMTEEDVHQICQYLEEGYKVKQIIEMMGWEYTDNLYYNLNHIKNGHRWKHISSQYNIPSANR